MQCASPTARNLGIRTTSVDLRWDDFPIIDSSFWRTPALIVSLRRALPVYNERKEPEADDDKDSDPKVTPTRPK